MYTSTASEINGTQKWSRKLSQRKRQRKRREIGFLFETTYIQRPSTRSAKIGKLLQQIKMPSLL